MSNQLTIQNVERKLFLLDTLYFESTQIFAWFTLVNLLFWLFIRGSKHLTSHNVRYATFLDHACPLLGWSLGHRTIKMSVCVWLQGESVRDMIFNYHYWGVKSEGPV